MYTQNNVGTITDMRLNPKSLLKKTESNPIFMFYRSKPKAVLMSVENYQKLQDVFEDYMLSLKAKEYIEENDKKIKWSTVDEIKDKIK